MYFTEHTYTVAPVFVAALINGDVSALDADEVAALDAFLAKLTVPGHWDAPDTNANSDDWSGVCDITRKRGPLVRVLWFVRHDDDAAPTPAFAPAALTVAIRLHGEDVTVVDPATFDEVDLTRLENIVAALKASVSTAIDDVVASLLPRTPVCSACLAGIHAAGEPDFAWRPTLDGEACGADDHPALSEQAKGDLAEQLVDAHRNPLTALLADLDGVYQTTHANGVDYHAELVVLPPDAPRICIHATAVVGSVINADDADTADILQAITTLFDGDGVSVDFEDGEAVAGGRVLHVTVSTRTTPRDGDGGGIRYSVSTQRDGLSIGEAGGWAHGVDLATLVQEAGAGKSITGYTDEHGPLDPQTEQDARDALLQLARALAL